MSRRVGVRVTHPEERPITNREVNRAFLARQLLLERSSVPTEDAISHLVGLQAQLPNPPYIGLWSRLAGFDFDRLSKLFVERKVVRIALMRDTIHLVTAEDALSIRPLLQSALERRFKSVASGKKLEGLDLEPVVRAAARIVDTKPVTFAELGELLSPLWPERDPTALAHAARNYIPLVQVPPRGVWGKSGAARHLSLKAWLRASGTSARTTSMRDLATRYLKAFGPASVADIQSWSGLTGFRRVFEEMKMESSAETRGGKDRLLVFRDETDNELYDLADSPRPEPDTPAPVRLLPMWDNALLSHKDRRRILGGVDREAIYRINGIIPGTILVDGFVGAIWSSRPARRNEPPVTDVSPLVKLSKSTLRAIGDEVRLLMQMVAPEKEHRVVFGDM